MKRTAAAIWTFVVGDDWVTAAGVVIAGAATAALQSAGVAAWWVIPAAVLILLGRSLVDRRRLHSTEGHNSTAPSVPPAGEAPLRRSGSRRW